MVPSETRTSNQLPAEDARSCTPPSATRNLRMAGNTSPSHTPQRPPLPPGTDTPQRPPLLPGAETPRFQPTDQGCRSGTPTLRSARGAAPAEGTVRVQVAARVRPLLPLEIARQASNCIEVAKPTIAIGKSCFTFDHAFDPSASQEEVFEECVRPLVDATFEGVNGTLLAYGQTGSGKTFTMGTSGLPNVPDGALQKAIHAIFAQAEERTPGGSTTFRASFVEIFTESTKNEEIRDLLSHGRGQIYATLKLDSDGQIRVDGALEQEVCSARETIGLLNFGSTARATCSTRMNQSSSRSHALFSLEVIQNRIVDCAPTTLTAKFQFVDLAGSEKVKLSGVEGEQLTQAININHGLFVLGKVITALTEGHPHVPFRESKLTRILQQSLGGNSRTCMIACVSPSDANLAETISTLTYAAKAKDIRNKPVVNRGASCQNCASLQAKLNAFLGEPSPQPASLTRSASLMNHDFLRVQLAELEKENLDVRKQNCRLTNELQAYKSGGGPRVSMGGAGGDAIYVGGQATRPRSSSPGETSSQTARLAAAEARAVRAEMLYRRCSERLAVLQQAAEAADLAVDDSFLNATIYEDALEGGGDEDEYYDGSAGDAGGGSPQDEDDLGGDLESDLEEEGISAAPGATILDEDDDSEVAWLEREAKRKQRLLLQVEENHQAMAVLEAEAQERIRQHEAARDIAERELARLKQELENARKKQETLKGVQERYDQRVAALKDRKSALEQERREVLRLRNLQKQQETRLRVLQDSIRHVKEERDTLRSKLKGEVKRRKEDAARGQRERKADQATIKTLSARVASLERSRCPPLAGAGDPNASCARLRRARSAPKVGCASLRSRSLRSRSHTTLRGQQNHNVNGLGGGPWERLLNDDADAALRERQLNRAQARLEELQAQMVTVGAQKERLSMEAEVDGIGCGAELAASEAETAALSAALEYQREAVWVLRREHASCQRRNPREAAIKLADGMTPGELVDGLGCLASEASRLREEAALAHEARDAQEADAAACRAALAESQHQAAEMEQSFDMARGEYESRVAFLLSRLSQAGSIGSHELQGALGEEAVGLLTRRVADLEEALAREQAESKKRGQRKIEQDLELITASRQMDSENKLLKSRLSEATAKSERTIARAAHTEARLRKSIAEKEQLSAEADKKNVSIGNPLGLEASWGFEYLEDFWEVTGLGNKREELLEALRSDIQDLCRQRLSDCVEWKEALEKKIASLRHTVQALTNALGVQEDVMGAPSERVSLLQVEQQLEASVASLTSLQERRVKELADLTSQVDAVHLRLFEEPGTPVMQPSDPGALRPEALAKVREHLNSLNELERERQEMAAQHVVQLQRLWETLGLAIPEGLEPREAELLQSGQPPISDGGMAYMADRSSRLAALRDELEPEECALQDRLWTWRRRLEAVDLQVPEVPEGLPLVPCIEQLRSAVETAEATASDFVREEQSQLIGFFNTARLPNVEQALQELDGACAGGVEAELEVLAKHRERTVAQRVEHDRVAELVAGRGALEQEMRDFDAACSDPARFRRRGYSGVQESRCRADYQQRLRVLDASITASIVEWTQREGASFRLGGEIYRGNELLPAEHTHMYAWTSRQLNQRQAGARPSLGGDTEHGSSRGKAASFGSGNHAVGATGEASVGAPGPATGRAYQSALKPRTSLASGYHTPRSNASSPRTSLRSPAPGNRRLSA